MGRSIWRNIDEHDGYQVSDRGEVRSYMNNRYGPSDKNPHMLKPCKNAKGYDTVQLGRGVRKLVHRLVAEAFIPNPDNLPMVRHMDDNPSNNHVSNLAWGTQTDNMQDCVKHGRLVGDTSYAIQAKRVPVRVFTVTGDYIGDFSSMSEAARQLDIWTQHISSVLRGKLRQTGGYIFEYIDKEAE